MTISTGTPIPTGLPTTAPVPSAEPPGVDVPLPRTDDDTEDTDTNLAVPLGDRLRGALPFTSRPGLTAAGGAVLGGLFVGAGAALDLSLGGTLGLGFRVTFVLSCVVVALMLRVRALAAAVVLPPLLFAGAAMLQTWSGGQTAGRREMALDVATTLALSAPTLFFGTVVAAAVAIVRFLVHLARR